MTDSQGCLRKMQTELAETVRYTVFPEQGALCLSCLLYTSDAADE